MADRWVIAATGAEEGSGAASHSVMEFDQKDGVYRIIADVFSLSGARIVLEGLVWQEALVNGVHVPPPESIKQLTKPKRVRRSK